MTSNVKSLQDRKTIRAMGQKLKATVPGRQWVKQTRQYEIVVESPDELTPTWYIEVILHIQPNRPFYCDGKGRTLADAEKRCVQEIDRVFKAAAFYKNTLCPDVGPKDC